ncbi:3-phytase precursor [Mariniflexile rhizosphaerae]|uniref:phytase n=1 Tax=unclassified Mariniflexile TaxID=2643887 RepID=UPI000CC738DA|nr:phytase [Mariniflexile sp. TRM1-10]AXP80408.1 3-phytase precursor [Mariniflexile sp. TRM1-10]PLB20573.1 MAG: Phytase [Flavobacteriaceae bacterium FS1-H7996/R]
MNKVKVNIVFGITVLLLSCATKLPEIVAKTVTEKTPHDTDDPAIWINKNNPEQSIVFGTDKDDVNGGVYAFDLDGKIIKEKSITNISYPNNVDVAHGFKLNDSTTTDIMVFSEREKHQIRLFSVPDMIPLDHGGFKVFEDETHAEMKRPMGVSLYKNPVTGHISVFVSRKKGPTKGYLYQYELVSDSLGVKANLLRKLGAFSGQKEIEAIAVDDEAGFVYYSDEGIGIRKYHANPIKGDVEVALFGGEHFKDDIEGIAITKYQDRGYLIVSNQQKHTFNIFSLETNAFIKELNLGTIETDGCDVTTIPLGSKFPNGLFVSMNDEMNFFFHDLADLKLVE